MALPPYAGPFASTVWKMLSVSTTDLHCTCRLSNIDPMVWSLVYLAIIKMLLIMVDPLSILTRSFICNYQRLECTTGTVGVITTMFHTVFTVVDCNSLRRVRFDGAAASKDPWNESLVSPLVELNAENDRAVYLRRVLSEARKLR
jgi:hypothetical protein